MPFGLWTGTSISHTLLIEVHDGPDDVMDDLDIWWLHVMRIKCLRAKTNGGLWIFWLCKNLKRYLEGLGPLIQDVEARILSSSILTSHAGSTCRRY